MKITFFGATEMVTGSCFLLETDNHKILIDCGLFQGGNNSDEMNNAPFLFNPLKIDYLLLTHAHIDHSGRIPLLVKRGFNGEIISTKATKDLCDIMLKDSGYIQEMEVEWVNRKGQRAGKPLIEPLYTAEEAELSLDFFKAIQYNEIITLSSDIKVRYRNAGHILGAAIIEIWIIQNNKETKIVFSGDLGNTNIPIMKDPSIINDADYLILEATYGNRIHKEIRNTNLFLLDIITDTIEKGGNVVIPSFAVGRSQELLYMLNALKESRFSKIKEIPVFLDSPLAINATKIFEENSDLFDKDTKELLKKGDNPFEFPNLVLTKTAEESKAINFYEGSCIIVSASGMCEAGRIKHHLKHNLWKGNSSVVFVGYQANGTLGRRILDGEKKVRIFGEEIYVNCNLYDLEGLSGHADKEGIIEWISSFNKKPKKIFLVHGEKDSLDSLSYEINHTFGIDVEIAKFSETVHIAPYEQDISYECLTEKKDTIYYFERDLISIKNNIDTLIAKIKDKEIAIGNKEYNSLQLKIGSLLKQVERINNSIKS